MSVGVTATASVQAGTPVALFQTHRCQPNFRSGRFLPRCKRRRAEISSGDQGGRTHRPSSLGDPELGSEMEK